jgi:hypothetical protein
MLEPDRTYTAAELIDIGLSRVAELRRRLDVDAATRDDRKELDWWIETLQPFGSSKSGACTESPLIQ